jgi:TPR repeat protein
MILGAIGFLCFAGGGFAAVNQENSAFAFGGFVILVVFSVTGSIIMQRYNVAQQQAALDAQEAAPVAQQTSSTGQASPAQQSGGNSSPSPAGQLAAIKSRAEKGDAQSQFELAIVYDNGDLGLAQDHGKSFAWCQKAANQGLPVAEYWMGRKYLKGVGVTANKSDAMCWLKKAAAQGYQPAKDDLLKESV